MNENPKIRDFPPSSTWRETLMLFGVALVLSLIAWFVHPHALSLKATASTYELDIEVPLISAAEALAAFDDPDSFHVFIDTRPLAEELFHVPGAVVLRPDSFRVDVRVLIEDFDRGDDLILYGDQDLVIPASISRQLKTKEFHRVRIMQGGFPAWLAIGGDSSPPYMEPSP